MYFFLTSSAVASSLMSRISYGLRRAVSTSAGHKREQEQTYLSLNAFRMRSTSISRWKAVASRLSSFSMSSAEGPPCLEDEGVFDDHEGPDMVADDEC